MSCLFGDGTFGYCSSLLKLPDISKWNTKNVTNMKGLFCGCSSLKFLPDISKWNMNNVQIYLVYFLIVHLYILYQIFQNGIYKMLQI